MDKYYDAVNWLAKNTLVINESQRVEKYKHIEVLDELIEKYKKLTQSAEKSTQKY